MNTDPNLYVDNKEILMLAVLLEDHRAACVRNSLMQKEAVKLLDKINELGSFQGAFL